MSQRGLPPPLARLFLPSRSCGGFVRSFPFRYPEFVLFAQVLAAVVSFVFDSRLAFALIFLRGRKIAVAKKCVCDKTVKARKRAG